MQYSCQLVPLGTSVQVQDHPNPMLIQGFLIAKQLMHLSPVIPWDLDNISVENKALRDLVAKAKTSEQTSYVFFILKSIIFNPLSLSMHLKLWHTSLQDCISLKQSFSSWGWACLFGGEKRLGGCMLFEYNSYIDCFTPLPMR